MVCLLLYRKTLQFSSPCLATVLLANLESEKCNESEEEKGNTAKSLVLIFEIRTTQVKHLFHLKKNNDKKTWTLTATSYTGEKK